MNYKTQMEAAKKGIVTKEMLEVSKKESIDVTPDNNGSTITFLYRLKEETNPPYVDIVYRAIDETQFVCTLEDHNIVGGLGSAVAEVVAEYGKQVKFKRFGLNGFTVGYGPYEELKEKNDIGKKSVQGMIEDWMA